LEGLYPGGKYGRWVIAQDNPILSVPFADLLQRFKVLLLHFLLHLAKEEVLQGILD